MNPKTSGIVAVLTAACLWAVEPILVKFAYRSSDFVATSAVRAVTALTLTGLCLLRTGGSIRLSRRQVPAVLYLAVVSTIVADLLYYVALMKVPVVNAVLLGHLQPVLVVMIGWLILHEDRLTRYDYTGILIMLVSALLVTSRTPANLLQLRLGTTGDLMVLAATTGWATTTIVARKYLRDLSSGVLAMYRYSLAAIVFTAYVLWRDGLPRVNRYQVMVGALVGVGMILYYYGLRRLKAAQVSALELASPFFAALLGAVVLHEPVTGLQGVGIFLLCGGVYFLARHEEAEG